MSDLTDIKPKMAAVGKKDFVQLFSAVGFDTIYTDLVNIDDVIPQIANDYSLIVTVGEQTKVAYNDVPYPIILPIKEVIA